LRAGSAQIRLTSSKSTKHTIGRCRLMTLIQLSDLVIAGVIGPESIVPGNDE